MRWIILCLICILSCATMTHADTTQPAQGAAAAGNLFAVDLYAQLRALCSGNICISPLGISSALNMAAAGAGGNTAEQMLAVLHWTGAAAELPAASSALISELSGTTDHADAQEQSQPLISIASALFSQSGFPYHQAFVDVLKSDYRAPLREVDFAKQPQAACDQINQWAAQNTHDKIKNAIPRSAITPLTRLILINAIYFKGRWEHEFSKSATQNQPFFIDGSSEITAALMQQKTTLGYMENNDLQAVELPYTGEFSLVVLLPRKRDGLVNLEKSITADAMAGWIRQLNRQQVQIYLPRFKFEGEYELSRTLATMGMHDSFDRNTADFSGVTSAEKLNIDRVIHKTFIDLDEAGTEAAAVTSITMRATAMRAPPREDPRVFRADHPFVYVLRHRPTGAILFLGRVTNPA